MRKIVILFLLMTSLTYSQILEPVKWSTEIKKISNTEYDLIIHATIDEGYHLYSQKVPDDGPLPTIFIFEKNDNYELVEATSEEKGHVVFDPVFELNIKYFDTKATFKQRIKVTNKKQLTINVEIEFMTCNDANCITGYDDVEFTI